MAAKCFRDSLDFLRNDRAVLDFMKIRSTWHNGEDLATVPEARHLAFRISFWDENVDRQPSPYIAEIRVNGGRCRYFSSNEHQQLVLVREETLGDIFTSHDESPVVAPSHLTEEA